MFEEPKHPKLKEAYQYLLQDRQQDALALADEVIDTEPANPEALILKAHILIRRRKLDEAERLLKEAEQAGGSSESLLRDRIRLAMERDDFESALAVATQYADQPDGSNDGFRFLAFELTRASIAAIFDDQKRKLLDAQEDRLHEIWLARSPDDVGAIQLRIRQDIFLKRTDRALADAIAICADDPEDPARQRLLLEASLAVGDEPRLLSALEACHRLGADFEHEQREIVGHYLKLKHIPAVRKLLDLGPLKAGSIALVGIIILAFAISVSPRPLKPLAFVFVFAAFFAPFAGSVLGAWKMKSTPELRPLLGPMLAYRVNLIGAAYLLGLLGLVLTLPFASRAEIVTVWAYGALCCGMTMIILGFEYEISGVQVNKVLLTIAGMFIPAAILCWILVVAT